MITTAKSIILVEGILIFTNSNLYNLFDIKIYVDTDNDIRLIRRIQRDVKERGRSIDSIITQYLTTVRPMHIQYVEPSKRNADIIVPVGLNNVVLDLVVSKLKSHLLLTNGIKDWLLIGLKDLLVIGELIEEKNKKKKYIAYSLKKS